MPRAGWSGAAAVPAGFCSVRPSLSVEAPVRKLLVPALILACFASLSVVGTAQVKKGKTRAATTKQLMSGVVQPNCAALGKGTKEAPADDKGWAALATNAALLNEMSYQLMDDGRCPDGTWADAAKALRAASEEVLKKVEAKDQAGAAAAFGNLTKSCGACHMAHKK